METAHIYPLTTLSPSLRRTCMPLSEKLLVCGRCVGISISPLGSCTPTGRSGATSEKPPRAGLPSTVRWSR